MSEKTLAILAQLRQLFESFQGENPTMSYTMEDFTRDYIKEHFPRLTPEALEEVLQSLPLEKRLAGLSAEQIRQYLEKLSVTPSSKPSKSRRKR